MNSQETEQTDFVKMAFITIIGVFVLAVSVYGAYRYSQKQSGNIILPGGVTYLGPSKKKESPPPTIEPSITPILFTAPSDISWDTYNGTKYPYNFSYPSTLPLTVFKGDISDSVAINWGGIPAEQNILLNIEYIEKRDAKYVTLPKIEYVRNWHTFFSGLKDVKSIDPFTNTKGLKGYKARYLNFADESPNVNVFFEVPNNPKIMIHLANGILDPKIFDRIIDTLSWGKTTPLPTSKQTAP